MALRVPVSRMYEIVNCKRAITPRTGPAASPAIWDERGILARLQSDYTSEGSGRIRSVIKREVQPRIARVASNAGLRKQTTASTRAVVLSASRRTSNGTMQIPKSQKQNPHLIIAVIAQFDERIQIIEQNQRISKFEARKNERSWHRSTLTRSSRLSRSRATIAPPDLSREKTREREDRRGSQRPTPSIIAAKSQVTKRSHIVPIN